jgi:murein DD-endopeptidase MepM/ murein hydrolase activator NlpD
MSRIWDFGGPDPTDNLPSPPPSPDPTNTLGSTPSTTPIATSAPSSTPASTQISTDPPADFTTWVNTALQSRLGLTKYGLIPAADKKDLIRKIWSDPTVQSDYVSNHANLSSGNVSSLAILENQIQSVMMGQGNDPTIAIDYTNMLQAAGVSLTASEQAGLSGATQAINAPVPRPFGTNVVSGYDFGAPMPAGGWSSKSPGESFGWDKHNGVDYGTRAGDRIVSPFSGTVTVQTNVPGYGNYVIVTLDNGWKMGFGHVASGAVQNGARVNPGDLIAIAGADVGSAQGSVTLVTWQDANGMWHNPHQVLDPIFDGTTFAAIGAQGAAGTGMPTVNKILDSEYPSIKADFQTFFGHPPSPGDVYEILQHGNSPAQWLDYIRAMPSHIDTMTQGQYYDLRAVADVASTKVLGHPSTDSIVQELAQAQLTTPQAALNWYNEHGVTGIPPEDYQKIYKANQSTMNAIFNEPAGADPRDIQAIHDAEKVKGGHGAVA